MKMVEKGAASSLTLLEGSEVGGEPFKLVIYDQHVHVTACMAC